MKNQLEKQKIKSSYSMNGFDFKVKFASVNFANDNKTPLMVYEDVDEIQNEDDEICIIELKYCGGQYIGRTIIKRDINPDDYVIV